MKISLAMCPIWNTDQPPLAIAYISGQLKSAGHEVFCHDFSVRLLHSIPEHERAAITQTYLLQGWYTDFEYWRKRLVLDALAEKWAQEILSNNPVAVGFSIYDSTLSVSLLLAEVIKKQSPETIIIFGGPSCDNKELILRGPVDFLVVGEGERTVVELVSRLENNSPYDDCPGLVFLRNGIIFETGKSLSINDINTIPFPDFDGFDLSGYPARLLPMFTSRGCPNRCSFCSESPRWGRYRYRTAENIVAEMERNVRKYNITHYSMEDSTINGNIKEFEKMCDLIISEKLDVTWGGKARTETKMTPELIQKAYKAGCRGFIFGIESGSQKVLDHMKKNVKIRDVEEVMFNSYRAGIDVGCFFIAGYVNETEMDFEETLNFIRRNSPYIKTVYPGSSGLHILRGSQLYSKAEEYGIILPEASPDGEWRTTDGANTGAIRADRMRRLNNLVKEL